MACRAEKAEAELAAAKARIAELELAAEAHGELSGYFEMGKRALDAEQRLAAIDSEVGPEPARNEQQMPGVVSKRRFVDAAYADHYKHRAEQLAAKVVDLQCQVQRGLSVVTAAVHLCNHYAAHDRHMLLFSLDQALVDNGFKQR